MLLLIAIASYLIGSIPFALLFARMKGVDLRQHGSKNIGATNALRVMGWTSGALTLLCDFSKGYLPCYLSHMTDDRSAPVAMVSAVLGHIFPVWLRFKGGKGVATALGAVTFLAPTIALISAATWGITFVISGISSLASLAGCISALISCFLFSYDLQKIIAIAIVLTLITLRHHGNIVRLMSGTEAKFRKDES